MPEENKEQFPRPSKKHTDYWRERFKLLEESQNRKGRQCYAEIEAHYRRAQREIEGKIAAWYQRFADNNKITLQEAKRLLRGRELAEFKWDVQDYIRYGGENALNQQWMKELENASARYHITRLEALKLHMQQSIEAMTGNVLDGLDGAMRGIYMDGYYHTAYEMQKGLGVGWNFATLDDKTISKVIKKPWAADGKNFSTRVWDNRTKLVGEINQTLTQNIILGQDPQKAIDTIAKKMNTSKHNAGRLVMTEEAFFSSAAQRDCFQELDVQQYEIVATLDSHTSELCRDMDGKHFPTSQYEPGATVPPFHVYCRSTTVPYFDDDYGIAGGRAARGADGKTYYVPADMTYREWEKCFVDGSGKSELQDIKPNATVKRGKGGESHADITKEWTAAKGEAGSVVERQEYIIDGTTYKVDGKHVVLKPTEQERLIAEILSKKYGKTVELVPQVLYPQGIQTPDYLIDGERYDLKSPKGTGKNLLYGLIAKKRKQSHNFVVDITNCPLDMEKLEKQIDELYISPRVGFLEKLVLIKNGEVAKVLSRQPDN